MFSHLTINDQLIQAAKTGNITKIRELLKQGAQINYVGDEEFTALQWAAFEKHPETVRLLLENNAEVDQEDDKEDTALIAAARVGCIEAMRILLEYGASIHHANQTGYTALNVAELMGYEAITQMIREQDKELDSHEERTNQIRACFSPETRKKNNRSCLGFFQSLFFSKRENQEKINSSYLPKELVTLIEDYASPIARIVKK